MTRAQFAEARFAAARIVRPLELRELQVWARQENLLLDNAAFDRAWRACGAIAGMENQVLKGTDDYSREFLREYRAATEQGPTVNVALRTNALKVSDGAVKIGNNVVTAAKGYLWVDAVNGAAIFKST